MSDESPQSIKRPGPCDALLPLLAVVLCGLTLLAVPGAQAQQQTDGNAAERRATTERAQNPMSEETVNEELPNIVLLFADDLGYGDLSSFGHPTIRTPTLDRLGREGMKLTSFYAAAPGCTPSRAALMTGRYAGRTGVWNVIFPNQDAGLPAEEITIAEALPDAYRTYMVGKWHLGHSKEKYLPTSQGFDRFFGLPYSNDMKRPWVQTDTPIPLLRSGGEVVEEPVDQSRLTPRYTEQAVEYVREAAGSGDPFFLYMAYNMPHLPLAAPERFRGQSEAGRYGDVVEMIDWSAGQILAALERQGMAENTIVIFTSDNGPWSNMPDRMVQGGVRRQHAGSPGLLRGAKGQTYEGGLRVPAVIRWPAQMPEDGRTTAAPASTLDLLPTLVTAAGGTVPEDRPLDGYNLLPLLRGETDASPRDQFFYHQSHQLEAVREGAWKLRVEQTQQGAQPPELYNVELDPGERHNRAGERPDKVERLKDEMRGLARRIDSTTLGF